MVRKRSSGKTPKKAGVVVKPKALSGFKPVSAPSGKTKSAVQSRRSAEAENLADLEKPAVNTDVQEDRDIESETPRTYLSEQEMSEFRQLLLSKRIELVGDVNTITNEALHSNEPGGAGNLSTMPIHMADIGSDNWEQEFNLSLMETEKQMLREIDAALVRIEKKTYGICEATHHRINKRRLRAQPWARYCIEYARQKEKGLVR